MRIGWKRPPVSGLGQQVENLQSLPSLARAGCLSVTLLGCQCLGAVAKAETHLSPRQGKEQSVGSRFTVEFSPSTEHGPAFTHTVELREQLWADGESALWVAGLQRAYRCTVFVLRFCNLSTSSSYVSMTCGECSQSRLM